MYTLEEGKLAVKIARKTIENHVRGRPNPEFDVPEKFKIKSGVFVTIDTYPKKELRGCIGHPEPIYPLIDALVNAAKSSATEDPRFPPVREDELDKIVIEVSLLTPPQLIKVKKPLEYLDMIEIGRDGLIVEKGFYRGLLLPQVPVEWNWDKEEFLAQTCWKAGLPPESWLDTATKIYKFTAEIFTETAPYGEIVEKVLTKGHT